MVWYTALSGVSYATHWFPSRVWVRAARSLRTGTIQPPGEGVWVPQIEDDAFWAMFEEHPNRLNDAQANWVILFSGMHNAVFEVRDQDRAQLGATELEKFSPFWAMF